MTSRSIESSSISRLFNCAIDGFICSAVLALVFMDYMPIIVADDSICFGDYYSFWSSSGTRRNESSGFFGAPNGLISPSFLGAFYLAICASC